MLLPRKSLFFFFFKEIRIVSNNLPPKVFLRSNADPTVKQERLIQKYLLFWVGEEGKEAQYVELKRLIQQL